MSALADALALAARAAPGAVAALGGADGLIWSGAAGRLGPEEEAGSMREDALFRIFSMTKAVGCICAAQLVERGVLDLDAPVARYAREFDEIPVLEGFDGETPVLRKQRRQPTIRDLMTHAAGLDYEFWNPTALRHMQATGRGPAGPNSLDGLRAVPIYAEDGGWSYGISIDWLGLAMARAADRPVDTLLRETLLDPLGMKRTVFEQSDAVDLPLTQPATKTEDGFKPSRLSPPANPEFYGLGHALWSTAGDYLRLLRMLLRGGELEGARVLRPETVAMLFSTDRAPIAASRPSALPHLALDMEPEPRAAPRQGMAFLVTTCDLEGRRRAGSGFWAGILNTHFWVDPAADLAGVMMTQLQPFGDRDLMAALLAFERAAYAAREGA